MTIPFDTLLEGIGYVVSGAAVLAAIIPTAGGEKASKALRFVRRVIDVLAMNVGNAKNATDAAKAQDQQKVK